MGKEDTSRSSSDYRRGFWGRGERGHEEKKKKNLLLKKKKQKNTQQMCGTLM